MANIVIFEPGETPQLLKSVNTPDYCDIPENKRKYSKDKKTWGTTLLKDELPAYAKPNVLINPDTSAVKNVPNKYWKRVGDIILEMSLSEKQAVDDAEKQSRLDAIENYQFDGGSLAEALVDAGVVTKDQVLSVIKAREGLV